jgi:hypothetical protein
VLAEWETVIYTYEAAGRWWAQSLKPSRAACGASVEAALDNYGAEEFVTPLLLQPPATAGVWCSDGEYIYPHSEISLPDFLRKIFTTWRRTYRCTVPSRKKVR